MHGTYVGNGRMLVATEFGAKLLCASDDLSLMPDLVVAGGYDEPFTSFVSANLSAGQVAVDVGANIGLFTMLMAWQVGPTGQVLSYECEPGNLQLLRDNVAMNYAAWVEVSSEAVGAERGTATLFRPVRFHGHASIVDRDTEHAGMPPQLNETDVRVVPLDDLIGRFERIDLIKIDVEGAEQQVFAGMQGLLASGTVDRVSVEIVRSSMPDNDWDSLVEHLRGLTAAGWSLSTISPGGLPADLSLERLIEHAHFSQVLLQAPARRAGA